MKSKKSIVGVVLGLLLFVFAIFIIITNGKDIKSIDNSLNSLKSYSQYYGGSSTTTLKAVLKLTKIAAILSLVGGIILVLFQILNVGLFITDKKEAQQRIIISSISIYIVFEIAAIILTMSACSRASTSVPGRTIAGLICDLIALVALIGSAMKLKDSDIDNYSKIFGVLASVMMLTVAIVLYLVDSPSTLNTLSGVIYIFCALGLCVFTLLPTVDYSRLAAQAAARRMTQNRTSSVSNNDELRPLFTQTSAPASTPKPQQKSQNPVEALKELKELLDSGIITQEEYNEKRKKYIDLL